MGVHPQPSPDARASAFLLLLLLFPFRRLLLHLSTYHLRKLLVRRFLYLPLLFRLRGLGFRLSFAGRLLGADFLGAAFLGVATSVRFDGLDDVTGSDGGEVGETEGGGGYGGGYFRLLGYFYYSTVGCYVNGTYWSRVSRLLS